MGKKRCINPGLGVRPVRKSKALVIIAVTLMIITVAAPLALAEIYNWTQVNSAGFGKPRNFATKALVEYNGRLYAGVWGSDADIGDVMAPDPTDWSTVYSNCEVWAYNGSAWSVVATAGFGDAGNGGVRSMAVYNGMLYAGTDNRKTGCELWRYNGSSWAQVAIPGGDGFGLGPANYAVESMVEYGGSLYVATKGLGQIWRYNGSSWAQINQNNFSDSSNSGVLSLAVYNNRIYAGTHNGTKGCRIYRYESGSNWAGSSNFGFNGDANNICAWEMELYRGRLYVATENSTSGVEVWAFDGSSWTQANTDGFGDPANVAGLSMQTFAGRLLVGTENWSVSPWSEVWELYRGSWSQVSQNGFGKLTNICTWSLGLYNDKVYAGTLAPPGVGTEIWTVPDMSDDEGDLPVKIDKVMGSKSWFLAEGSTGGGFDTWVLLQNPQEDKIARVKVTFATLEGPRPPVSLVMDPESRATIRIADSVPDNFHVSTIVESDVPIVAERSMYWDRNTIGDSGVPGGPQPYEMKGGHANLGIPVEAISESGEIEGGRSTYFPEGATAGGFDTWILLTNPSDSGATANVKLMTREGVAANRTVTVGALSRQTVHLDDYLPDAYEVSTEVSSSAPIVAERAMYWDPNAASLQPYQMTGGHSNDGSSLPGTDWFMAEGATAGGFDTWILVQNPQDKAANVNVSFMNQAGVAGQKNLIMGPDTRATVRVSDTVPNDFHVSARVTSDIPVIAERSMYWNKELISEPYRMRGGHSTVGVAKAGKAWMVAEGSTGGGFDSWDLITNVNDVEITVWFMFMTKDGPLKPERITIPAHARYTVHVNQYVPDDFQVSTIVASESDIVVERAMYWDKREAPGIQPYQMMGGHSAVGVDP